MHLAEIENQRAKLFSLRERYLATGSLYEFFKAAWPYIEGNMPYVDSWHIRANSRAFRSGLRAANKEADY